MHANVSATFVALATFASLLLTACATTSNAPKPTDITAAIEQATALAAGGETAKAIELMDAAAKLDPSSGKPWLKKAQIQFEQADYPGAILSAEQAAKREPDNKDARSVSIVAALRIAISGLAELRGQAGAGDNNAYLEAQRMAAVLRASLGTDALVPAEDTNASGLVAPAPQAASTPPKRKSAASRPAASKSAKKSEPANEPVAAPSGNPFKDLN